jgi:hypothetical protein
MRSLWSAHPPLWRTHARGVVQKAEWDPRSMLGCFANAVAEHLGTTQPAAYSERCEVPMLGSVVTIGSARR